MSLYSLDAVTIGGYRLHTGDQTTNGPTVSASLVEAEQMLDEELRRHLALDEYTDTFRVYPDGRIYPDAWPITDSTLTIDGRALLGAAVDVSQFVAWYGEDYPPRVATVTWTGGYDDGSNGTRLPRVLAHAIYDLAHALAVDSPAVLVGATSASVGDVSVSFASPGAGFVDSLVPGLSSRVRRYMNRFV